MSGSRAGQSDHEGTGRHRRGNPVGPFRLWPARQLLLEGDIPVHLGARAFDLLIALVERAGEVVTKDDGGEERS
jgi:DNA-binding response OmpR family regulator